MSGEPRPPLRCFVALWPDAHTAARLATLTHELVLAYPRARPVPRANLHLTLAFIGDLDAERAQQVAARLRAFEPASFVWTVDRVDRFAGPRVAWAGGPAPAALSELVHQVEALLEAVGVPFDHRPYRPHVTLLRHLPCATAGPARELSPPIEWQGGRAVLLRSASGRYVEVEPGR